MELEQLRVFVAAAQTRTFVEAAARLNKSQPAVTMTVKALEREMGVPLFAREGRGKRLTAAGARLAAKVAGILEGARRLKEDVAGEPEVPRGPARVGAGEGGLGFARRTRPWLSRYETSATWSRLRFEPLFASDRMLIVPRGHELAGKKRPTFRNSGLCGLGASSSRFRRRKRPPERVDHL